MASHLGVVIIEKDASQTQAALAPNTGAMAVYCEKGPSDKAYLCQSEDDIRKIFTNPHEKVLLRTGVYDYGRSLQNAFNFVRAGLPLWIKRAVAGTSPAYATADIQADGASQHIAATALGHGDWYNEHLRIYIQGIGSVNRSVTLATSALVKLDDVVLPRSLVITIGANTYNDSAFVAGGLTTDITLPGARTVTVTYEDAVYNDGLTTLLISSGADIPCTIAYQKTTADRVVQLYLVDQAELDKAGNAQPTLNYFETFRVSYKEEGKDESGNSIFIEKVINEVSKYIKVATDTSYAETALPIMSKADYSDVATFSGGADGTYGAGDADIVTALSEFDPWAKKRDYDFVKMFDAGFSDAVKKKIALVCQHRIWAHGYIDPKATLSTDGGNRIAVGLTQDAASQVAQDIVSWRLADMAMGPEAEFVSLAGSTWGVITDAFNGGRDLWMPPSYYVCQNAIYIDDVTKTPWKTTAGPQRGGAAFKKLAINLYQYRDNLNLKQCNGLYIDERGMQMYYGNKTMKPTPSAMQNTHARKTRGYLSREYYYTCLNYTFEDIDTATINDLQGLFEDITKKYAAALDSYKIVVGPPATTPADIQQQTLKICVGLIFKEVAEEIEITTTVFKVGTDISVAVVA